MSKGYVATMHGLDWSQSDEDWLDFLYNPRVMSYMVFVRQEGKEKKTTHLQLYVQFKNAQPKHRADHYLKGRWCEKQRGSAVQARAYIVDDEKKTNIGKVMERGEFNAELAGFVTEQGKRTDIDTAKDKIVSGEWSLMDVAMENPSLYSRTHRALGMIAEYKERKMDKEIEYPVALRWGQVIHKPDPKVKKRHWYLWGRPDLGKTYLLSQLFKNKRVYWRPQMKYPFESYDNQDIIIYDDVLPSIGELIDVSNTVYNMKHVYGDTRNKPVFWKREHTRTMIIMANHPPAFLDEAFRARFTVVHLDPIEEDIMQAEAAEERRKNMENAFMKQQDATDSRYMDPERKARLRELELICLQHPENMETRAELDALEEEDRIRHRRV